jgi:plasmid stability protein
LEIPDGLYRKVKARSALVGRPVRAVAVELFEKWLSGEIEITPDAEALRELLKPLA